MRQNETIGGNTGRLVRGLCALALIVAAACAPRATAMRAAPDPAATIQPVFVATGRELHKTGPIFGLARRDGLNYFRADISIPPTHATGQIEWPEGVPDAATDFVVTGTQVYQSADRMLAEMRRKSAGTETLVYIHGYNNTLSEAMYRLAQIKTDFNFNMPGVLFSWPSAGDARGYIYDRDSVLFARDDLVGLLRQLTARPGDKVFLLAHSMGSQLTMEALRQIAIGGDRHLLGRISGVVLMSPDIDPDVFQRQADAIGTLPQPFLIFITQVDRALSLSAFITGRKPRLGVIDSAAEVNRSDVQVIDFSALADGGAYNHYVPVTSPAAIEMLNAIIAHAAQNGTGFLQGLSLRLPPAEALER